MYGAEMAEAERQRDGKSKLILLGLPKYVSKHVRCVCIQLFCKCPLQW